MTSLKYIFAQPEYIVGIGDIYPVKLKDYDEFQKYSNLILISKNNFKECDIPLLGLIFMCSEELGITVDNLIICFEKLFSLVLKKPVKVNQNDEIFWFEFQEEILDQDNNRILITNKIDFFNYDIVRQTIMKQNLIFEPKIYKNKLVQEWANKVLESRAKNSANITIEDFITTVKNFDGLTYDQMMEQSIYQLYADFYRIGKMKEFDKSCLFATVSAEPISIQHFAQSLEMWKSPYDDLFVDSSKLDKFGSII